jgi:glycosyltransferase involved in cell wall biosynthesis
VGGASEAIVEGITGYTVAGGDVKTLHQRLLQLVIDQQLRAKMGAAGRKRYEAEYTFEKMLKKTFQVYEQVLAKRRKNGD